MRAANHAGKLRVQTCTACHAASAASPSCWKACGAMMALAGRPAQRQAEMAGSSAPKSLKLAPARYLCRGARRDCSEPDLYVFELCCDCIDCTEHMQGLVILHISLWIFSW